MSCTNGARFSRRHCESQTSDLSSQHQGKMESHAPTGNHCKTNANKQFNNNSNCSYGRKSRISVFTVISTGAPQATSTSASGSTVASPSVTVNNSVTVVRGNLQRGLCNGDD